MIEFTSWEGTQFAVEECGSSWNMPGRASRTERDRALLARPEVWRSITSQRDAAEDFAERVGAITSTARYRARLAVSQMSRGERAALRVAGGLDSGEHLLSRGGWDDLADRLADLGWQPATGKDEAARLLQEARS